MNSTRILITGNRDILNTTRIENLLYSTFSIFEIHGTESIVRSIQNNQVDMIISCSSNKEVDEVLQQTKEIRGRGLNTPIILITRHSPVNLAIAAKKAGINDYFKVPFSNETFINSINHHAPQPI